MGNCAFPCSKVLNFFVVVLVVDCVWYGFGRENFGISFLLVKSLGFLGYCGFFFFFPVFDEYTDWKEI